MSVARIVFCAVLIILGLPLRGQEPVPGNPADVIREGQNQKKALRIVEGVYQAVGFGNTFMVTTSEGNVIIDTSLAAGAAHHVKLLKAENAGPILILTHGHGDHTGGVAMRRLPAF
jgi:glyoxylase-like metal-dependent hydrolase (beta-lactamase superfamily II)